MIEFQEVRDGSVLIELVPEAGVNVAKNCASFDASLEMPRSEITWGKLFHSRYTLCSFFNGYSNLFVVVHILPSFYYFRGRVFVARGKVERRGTGRRTREGNKERESVKH